jgi:glycosyltransferase involved in cell wall biosynthesis
MKITIITVTLNSEATIENTIQSVLKQNYKNKEHIIIDGGSEDNTIKIVNKYKNKIKKILIERDRGVYDAINKGINLARGSIVSILHSNDVFYDSEVLSNISKMFLQEKKVKIIIGDTMYRNKKIFLPTRYYSAKFFKKYMMIFGYSPPHPSSFIKREVYLKYGSYKYNYKTAGDFEFFLRVLLKNKVKYQLVNKCYVLMRPGGISDRGVKSYYNSTIEILRAFRENKIYSNFFLVLFRFPIKLCNFIIRP